MLFSKLIWSAPLGSKAQNLDLGPRSSWELGSVAQNFDGNLDLGQAKIGWGLGSGARIEVEWTGVDWIRLGWTGLGWTGLGWIGADWGGLEWTGLG